MEGSIPTDIWGLYSLEKLNLRGNHMVSIPSGISQLCKLRYLDISHCKMLQEIPNKYHRKQPWHFLAAFDFVTRINGQATHTNIKRCGVQLIYTHDYLHDNVPMLVDHQRGHDDAGENQADDQEPHPKRLRASSTDLKL
ncbi:hypothetical protein CK203_091828 [Vitis vinifera]|uniref:Uncharacterized protein n=1 Tax=Vitis vinifera TaxID=29760 RepID=A0A438BLZ1_VITVI|nr:hypothetical protein CK203_091828 [Vitis vinifera]